MFTLTDAAGQAQAGRQVSFSLAPAVGAPADAGGATLDVDDATTDAEGRVRVQVLAGAPSRFSLVASNRLAAPSSVLVAVVAPVTVDADFLPTLVDAAEQPALVTVRFFFLPRANCMGVRIEDLAALSGAGPSPNGGTPLTPTLLAPGASARILDVPTMGAHAAVALGIDATGVARFGGCVDVPGDALLGARRAQVLVPMALRPVLPRALYQTIAQLAFTFPGGKSPVAQEWGELSACALDPARIWLDCTIDALDASAADKVDCRVEAPLGPLATKLSVRRGTPSAEPLPGRCRGPTDAGKQPSLDALAAALFPTPLPADVAALADIAAESTRVLDRLTVRGTFRADPTTLPGQYLGTHTLETIALQPLGEPLRLDLVSAADLTAAEFPVSVSGATLNLGAHGFPLRLGTALRALFSRQSLMPRALPTQTRALLAAVIAEARWTPPGATASLTGCAALDARLCPEVGASAGCLENACRLGLEALATNLDGAFTRLDGPGTDLVIEASAPLLDTDGDRRAEALGRDDNPGLWSGTLRTADGPVKVDAIWAAVATP